MLRHAPPSLAALKSQQVQLPLQYCGASGVPREIGQAALCPYAQTRRVPVCRLLPGGRLGSR